MLSECNEERAMMLQDASRSIFRESDAGASFPPSVMRANPVCLEPTHFAGYSEAGSFKRCNSIIEAHDVSISGRLSPSRSLEEMLDYDGTEDAEYQPTEELNPVFYHNSSNLMTHCPFTGAARNYALFFNSDQLPLLAHIQRTDPSGNVHLQQITPSASVESHLWQRGADTYQILQGRHVRGDDASNEYMQDSYDQSFSERYLSPRTRLNSPSDAVPYRSMSSSSSDSSLLDFESRYTD